MSLSSQLFLVGCAAFMACSSQPPQSSNPGGSATAIKAVPPTPGATDATTTVAVAGEPADPGETGRRLGRYQLTYYWVADEATIGGKPSTTLRDRRCKPIAKVSRKFRRALMREGSGKLRDGRVVNIGGGCRCGKRCFLVTDEESPYGLGVAGRSLKPFRSIAAPRHIAVGTILYVPELDGLTVPGRSPLGGTVHNGCVVADDRGGGVTGRQLDLFTGRRPVYKSFFRRHKLNRVTVHRAGARCDDLEAPGQKRGEG